MKKKKKNILKKKIKPQVASALLSVYLQGGCSFKPCWEAHFFYSDSRLHRPVDTNLHYKKTKQKPTQKQNWNVYSNMCIHPH